MKIQMRIDSPKILDLDLIDREIRQGKHVIIQFVDKNYDENVLGRLNELCSKYDESFGIRFYGHYSTEFDCKTVLKLPEVKCLYVDCLMKAVNINALSDLQNLRIFSLGIFESKETEILNSENFRNLKQLNISETRTKAINLAYLKEYKKLKSLGICGHSKNIDAVGEISELTNLYLHSVKKVPVNFINKLKKLKTLRFLLGSRENIQEVDENEIEHLDIDWVRGFNSLENISNFRKLKTLKIDSEIRLKEIHFDSELSDLFDMKVINCKTLTSIKDLDKLTSLNSLIIYKTNIEFEEFIKQKLPSNLKTLGFYTSKIKIDSEIKKQIEKRGYYCR